MLVFDDAVGAWTGHKPKFVRHFMNLKALRDDGVHKYAEATRSGEFPDMQAESYAMDQEEWAKFMEMMAPSS